MWRHKVSRSRTVQSEIKVHLKPADRQATRAANFKGLTGHWPCEAFDAAPAFPNSREKTENVASDFKDNQRWYLAKRDELIVLGEAQEIPTSQMFEVSVKIVDHDIDKSWTVLETKTTITPDPNRRRDTVLLDPEGRVQFRLLQNRGPWYLVAIRLALTPGHHEPILTVGDMEQAPEIKKPFRKRRASMAIGVAGLKPQAASATEEEQSTEKLLGKGVAPQVGMRVILSSRAPDKMLEDSAEGPGTVESVSEANPSKSSVDGDFCKVRWDRTGYRQVYCSGYQDQYHLAAYDGDEPKGVTSPGALFVPLADQYDQRKIDLAQRRDQRLQDRMAEEGGQTMGAAGEVRGLIQTGIDYIKDGHEEHGKGITKTDRLKACFALPLVSEQYPPIPTPALIGPNAHPRVHPGLRGAGTPTDFRVGTLSVAVIGSGVAAAALTKRLSCLEYKVTVFEQASVQGGRMGMEDCGGQMACAGAAVFCPHSLAFHSEVAEWVAKGICRPRAMHVGVIPGPCRGEVWAFDSVTKDFGPHTAASDAPDELEGRANPIQLADAHNPPPPVHYTQKKNVSDGLEGDSATVRFLYSRVWYNRGSVVRKLQEQYQRVRVQVKDISDLLILLNTQVESLETQLAEEGGPRWAGDTAKAVAGRNRRRSEKMTGAVEVTELKTVADGTESESTLKLEARGDPEVSKSQCGSPASGRDGASLSETGNAAGPQPEEVNLKAREPVATEEVQYARRKLDRANSFVQKVLEKGDGHVSHVLRAVNAFKTALEKPPKSLQWGEGGGEGEGGGDEGLEEWRLKAFALLKGPEHDEKEHAGEDKAVTGEDKAVTGEDKAVTGEDMAGLSQEMLSFELRSRAMGAAEKIEETERSQMEGEAWLVAYEKKLVQVEQAQQTVGAGHAVVGEPADVVVQFGFSHTLWPGDRVMLGLPGFAGCEVGRVQTAGRDAWAFGEARWFTSGMLTLFYTATVSLPAMQDVFVSVPGVVFLPENGVSQAVGAGLTICAVSSKVKTAQHALPSLLIHPTDGPCAHQASCFRLDFDAWAAPEPDEGLPLHRKMRTTAGSRGYGAGEGWYSFEGGGSELVSRMCQGVTVRTDHRVVGLSSHAGRHTLYTENLSGGDGWRRRVGFEGAGEEERGCGEGSEGDEKADEEGRGGRHQSHAPHHDRDDGEDGADDAARTRGRRRLSTRQATRRLRDAGAFDLVLLCTPPPNTARLLGEVAPDMARVAASCRQTGCWAGWVRIWPGFTCKYDAVSVHADPAHMLVWAHRSEQYHPPGARRTTLRAESRGAPSRSSLRSSSSWTARKQAAVTPGQRERAKARWRGGEAEGGEVWVMFGTPTWNAGAQVREGEEGTMALQMLDHLSTLLGMEDGQDVRAAGETWWESAVPGPASRDLEALHGAPEAACSHGNRLAMAERGGLGLTGVDGCLFDPARGLGVAGDWMVDSSVEGAFLSGSALADRVSESRGILTHPNYTQHHAATDTSGLTHDDHWHQGPWPALDADPTVAEHYWNGRPVTRQAPRTVRPPPPLVQWGAGAGGDRDHGDWVGRPLTRGQGGRAGEAEGGVGAWLQAAVELQGSRPPTTPSFASRPLRRGLWGRVDSASQILAINSRPGTRSNLKVTVDEGSASQRHGDGDSLTVSVGEGQRHGGGAVVDRLDGAQAGGGKHRAHAGRDEAREEDEEEEEEEKEEDEEEGGGRGVANDGQSSTQASTRSPRHGRRRSQSGRGVASSGRLHVPPSAQELLRPHVLGSEAAMPTWMLNGKDKDSKWGPDFAAYMARRERQNRPAKMEAVGADPGEGRSAKNQSLLERWGGIGISGDRDVLSDAAIVAHSVIGQGGADPGRRRSRKH